MSPEAYWPLISGFVGALIGASGPILVAAIQARKDERNHQRDLAARLALAERESHIDAVQKLGGGPIMPISLYMAHHIELIDLLSKGNLNPEDITAMNERLTNLRQALEGVEGK